MKKLIAAAVALSPLPVLAADLPARTAPPAPEAPIMAMHSWTGFYAGVNAGYLRTRDRNALNYVATQPNGLAFNTVQRNLVLGDPAVRSLSTPTNGSRGGPFPLFATADSPYNYFSTSRRTSDGTNETAQINSREVAANQAALDGALAADVLPEKLMGKQRDLFTGGAALGYNHQFSSVVIGVEADFSYLGRKPDDSFSAGAPVVQAVNPLAISLGGGDYVTSNSLIQAKGNNEALWLGTLRGRFGFAFDRALVYATGGLAFGRVRSSAAIAINDSFLGQPTVDAIWSGSYAKTRMGWALGGGFQYALTENWSLKGEYLHYDLGRHSYGLNASNPDNAYPVDSGDYAVNISARARTSGDIVRIGVNYRFGG